MPPVDPTFKLRLREALAAKDNMTQEALAREMGLSLRAVQDWCGGRSEPRGRQLVALSEVLNRDAGWFFSEPEGMAA